VYDVNLSDLSIAGDPKQNGAEIEQESTHTSYEKPADPQNNPRIIASPAAKRVAKELNVEIANIPIPEGKLRVEKGDVVNYHESISKRAETFSAQKTTADAVSESDHAYDVNGMRKIIATRMKESLNIAAHVSLTAEADMSSAIAMKSDIEQEVMETYGVKLSLNEIILKCVATALTQHPRMNSVFTQDQIIEKGEINLGVAIALEEGLVVPVIRNCNHLSIGTISKEVKRLTQKARETGLSPDDSTGGTFTVSNLGMFGIVQFTSIINQPESAILSVGKIVKRPVVLDDDEIKIRPIMNLTINFDHRPIDGAMAATFLKTLVKLLETPYLLLR
jgi:pyruvate dehydrogenase E2 component (dihydrolipoamide acetyltransferase)